MNTEQLNGLKNMKTILSFYVFVGLLFLSNNVFSQDQNFYIYLYFGQSNMESNARFDVQDTTVNNRFQVMEAVDCPSFDRIKGNWYPAVPPLCRCLWSYSC